MKICIVGASGQTGRNLMCYCLQARHEVSAIVRNKEPLNYLANDINFIEWDASTQNDTLFSNNIQFDHVVIVLGSKDLWGNTIRSEGTKHIINALLQSNNRKPHIWALSAAGVNESWSQLGFVSKLISKLLLPSVMKEHTLQERYITESGLNYTILRATGLTNEESQNYQLVTSNKLPNTKVSRRSIAQCMVDHFGKTTLNNKAITITGND